MKRSGLARIAQSILEFRKRGGISEAIVGIDEGGATIEGLRLALDTFDHVYVFHEPGARTFHPKVYRWYGESAAAVLIGSNNATAGGLYTNYEAAVLARLTLSEPDDSSFHFMINDWIATLMADTACCLPLTQDLLDQISGDPQFRIGHEFGRTDRDSDSRSAAHGPFSRSRAGKQGPPPRLSNKGNHPNVPPTVVGVPVAVGIRIVTHTWSKTLSASDAQRTPNLNSNPTGNVRLTKGNTDLDWRTYFRHHMFSNVNWAVRPGGGAHTEVAEVAMNVIMQGRILGSHTLRLSYAPAREAGQNNHTTVLHWGALIQPLLALDLTGARLTLNRFGDDTFELLLD